MAKYIITGANGYVGRSLCEFLKNKGYKDIITIGRKGCDYNVDLSDMTSTDMVFNDISFEEQMSDVPAPDCIFHFAGINQSQDWDELWSGNVCTTASVLSASRRFTCKKVVIGSAAEYGIPQRTPVSEEHPLRPISKYGLSMALRTGVAKRFAELGDDVVVARLFNLIGKGMQEKFVLGSFLRQLKGKTITVGSIKDIYRDFIDIEDACGAFMTIANKGVSGEVYNVCSGASYELDDILHMMLDASGSKAKVKVDPKLVRKNDVKDITGGRTKLRDIGWKPKYSMEDSVTRLFR
jgi:GDP-4-dehydro-6-deoxy-D-mannose reductase